MRRQGVGLAGLLVLVVLLVAVANLSVAADPKKTSADTQSAPAPTAAQLDMAKKAVVIVDKKCGSCHRFHTSGIKTVPWGDDVPQLIKSGRVIPGNPDKSSLYTYTGMTGKHRIADSDRKIIHDWIQDGAVDPKAPASKPASSPASKPAGG